MLDPCDFGSTSCGKGAGCFDVFGPVDKWTCLGTGVGDFGDRGGHLGTHILAR